MILGVARARRDRREAKRFHLVSSVASPDGRYNVLLYRKTPDGPSQPFMEIVAIDAKPNLQIEELWNRMKTSKTAMILESPTARDIAMAWSADSRLQISCSACGSDDLVQRAPRFHSVSIQLVGFPADASYTHTQPVNADE
jgi:hypothetical protein